MSIIDSFVEKLRPGTTRKLTQADVLEQLFVGSMGVRPNAWYRLANQNGDITGLSFVCSCLTEYKLIGILQWLVPYKCKACGAEFDLLKYLNVAPVIPAKDLAPHIHRLPVRPSTHRKQQNVFDTWDGGDDTVKWEGSDLTGGIDKGLF